MAVDKITVVYGSYVHPIGTTAYSTQRQTLFDGRKRPVMDATSVSITGIIHGDDPVSLQENWAALVDAYNQVGADFSIHVNGTPSGFTIFDAATIGGIRVTKQPSIPSTLGSAHVKQLPFQIELQATLPYSGSPLALMSFRESVSFSGGGPRTTMVEALTGPPVKQQVREQTVFRATQSGQAIGLFGLPVIPSPIWPSDLTGEYTSERTSPELFGEVRTNYPVSWKYEFESATAFNGLPNDWGVVL